MNRGTYDEIRMDSLDLETRQAIQKLVEAAGSSSDEHGSWEFGAAFDRKHRGTALNWDLYDYGHDPHSGQLLAIIQIRQAIVGKRWTNVRKNYFLCGYNEDRRAFAHSVSAAVVRSAVNRGVDAVKAVQDWMFGCDYNLILRQGDMALIPVRALRGAEPVEQREIILENSHQVIGQLAFGDGGLYVREATVLHLNGTHPVIQVNGQWHRVAFGQRADYWKFARPTKD